MNIECLSNEDDVDINLYIPTWYTPSWLCDITRRLLASLHDDDAMPQWAGAGAWLDPHPAIDETYTAVQE